MELSNNKSAGTNETAIDNFQTQMDVLSNQKVERVKSFSDYAFQKAGLNRGSDLPAPRSLPTSWMRFSVYD